jgi:hypothetical protein
VRKLAAVLVMGSMAALALVPVAGATGRFEPLGVTARVTPPRRLHAPYRFRDAGTIVYRHIVCPPGAKNLSYCVKVPRTKACSGRVRITITLGKNGHLRASGRRIGTFFARVALSCRYSLTRTIPKRLLTSKTVLGPRARGRFVRIIFTEYFEGNSVLAPRSGPRRVVSAQLANPITRRRPPRKRPTKHRGHPKHHHKH